jgi:hypothetical protein
MGDVASGALVAIGVPVFGLGVRAFALSNALLVILWIWLAFAIVRAHRAMGALPLQNVAAPENEAA